MSTLPIDPDLDHLRERAESLLRELQEQRPEASLADALAEIARRHGYGSWNDLVEDVESLPRTPGSVMERIVTAHAELRRVVDRLRDAELDLRTSSGWTIKGLLAHVAFWEETVAPGVDSMLRGRPWGSREDWHGGEAWDAATPFPQVDHNAREGKWGEARAAAEVMARLDRAHARLVATVQTFTAEEAHDLRFVRLVAEQTWRHYPEHLEEIAATVGRRS